MQSCQTLHEKIHKDECAVMKKLKEWKEMDWNVVPTLNL